MACHMANIPWSRGRIPAPSTPPVPCTCASPSQPPRPLEERLVSGRTPAAPASFMLACAAENKSRLAHPMQFARTRTKSRRPRYFVACPRSTCSNSPPPVASPRCTACGAPVISARWRPLTPPPLPVMHRTVPTSPWSIGLSIGLAAGQVQGRKSASIERGAATAQNTTWFAERLGEEPHPRRQHSAELEVSQPSLLGSLLSCQFPPLSLSLSLCLPLCGESESPSGRRPLHFFA